MQIKALVVDDSKVMRAMVMKNLRETKLADFEFIEAQDGKDGLEKFGPANPDILFVDWNMPQMTGIELVREIRSVNDDVPIVMVTSEKAMGKVMEAIDEAGADAYVCKPFTPAEFERKIGRLIKRLESKK